MYFAKHFSQASSGMYFQTMPSQVALSSVYRLALKIVCSTFNYLYLFERNFLQVQVVCKDDFNVPFVSFYVTLKSVIVCSELENVSFVILVEKDGWKLLNIAKLIKNFFGVLEAKHFVH